MRSHLPNSNESTYIVGIGAKLTSSAYKRILEDHWKRSLERDRVIFDLSRLTWISTEGITFLFAWIRTLIRMRKFVDVIFPYPNLLPNSEDSNKERDRRIRRQVSLRTRWEIEEACGLSSDNWSQRDDVLSNKRLTNFVEGFDGEAVRVIPFCAYEFDLSTGIGLTESIAELDSKCRSYFSQMGERVQEFLDVTASLDSITNQSLSNVVTKELLLNVQHHAFDPNGRIPPGCYFAISIRNPIRNAKSSSEVNGILSKTYREELIPEELEFFQKADGSREFRNEPFVEYCLVDFGMTVPKSLRENFVDNCIEEPTPSSIIKYAFEHSSSRNPISKSLKLNEFVPRGLYFVKRIAAIYGGMLVCRSGAGTVVFDFSGIAERVRSAEASGYFPGTMITLIIPAKPKRLITIQSTNVTNFALATQNRSRASLTNRNVLRGKPDVLRIYDILDSKLLSKSGSIVSSGDTSSYYQSVILELYNAIQERLPYCEILYLDFEGFSASDNIIGAKIYSYLCNDVRISNENRIVLTGVVDKFLLRDLQKVQGNHPLNPV
jgi:hypothetical protein